MKIVSQKERTTVERSAKIEFNREDIINALQSINQRDHPDLPEDAKVYISIPEHGNVYIGDDDELTLTIEFESKVVK